MSSRPAEAAPRGERLTVLHVINQLGPGGAERSLGDLVAPLAERGIDVRIACVYGVAEEYRRDYLPDCPVTSLGGGTLIAKAFVLRRLLGGLSPDLVHTTLFESNLVGRLGAAGSGVPVVTSLVNTEYEAVRRQDPRVGRLKLAAVQALERWTGRYLTSHFHAITEAVAASARRTLAVPGNRITVAYRGRDGVKLGLPGEERRARVRASLDVPADAEVVLHVARQEFQKGHEHLFRAVARLKPRRPRLLVLLAGRRGNTSAHLDRLHRELALGDTIRFLGSRSDVGDLLAAADLFVFPSLYEGLGGAVIEAMALGLPVVASDLPALREVVEEGRNAVLVPAADPEALAGGLEKLLGDRDTMRRFGARSRRIFEERFTIERSAAGMARLYRSIIEGTARGA